MIRSGFFRFAFGFVPFRWRDFKFATYLRAALRGWEYRPMGVRISAFCPLSRPLA
jgi:hypothetical protein